MWRLDYSCATSACVLVLLLVTLAPTPANGSGSDGSSSSTGLLGSLGIQPQATGGRQLLQSALFPGDWSGLQFNIQLNVTWNAGSHTLAGVQAYILDPVDITGAQVSALKTASRTPICYVR
jgi:hypothetical protein